ncbi:8958_t:CDS:1, partial [Racocetra persica]
SYSCRVTLLYLSHHREMEETLIYYFHSPTLKLSRLSLMDRIYSFSLRSYPNTQAHYPQDILRE